MTEKRSLRPLALTASLIASMALTGCGDARRSAHASTSVAEAEVSTKLPADQVSAEFLQATALVAAQAASVPHPVAATVVVPPEPAPPALPQDSALPQDNVAAGPAAPPADDGSNAAANAQ